MLISHLSLGLSINKDIHIYFGVWNFPVTKSILHYTHLSVDSFPNNALQLVKQCRERQLIHRFILVLLKTEALYFIQYTSITMSLPLWVWAVHSARGIGLGQWPVSTAMVQRDTVSADARTVASRRSCLPMRRFTCLKYSRNRI